MCWHSFIFRVDTNNGYSIFGQKGFGEKVLGSLFHVPLSCLPKRLVWGEEIIWGQEMNPCWSFGFLQIMIMKIYPIQIEWVMVGLKCINQMHMV